MMRNDLFMCIDDMDGIDGMDIATTHSLFGI